MLLGVTTFQWMFWGYSLAYSRTGGPFIGNMDHIGLRNVWLAPQGDIPDIAFCLYQLLFCAVTVQILIGGSFERGRILPSLLFAFFWATIVYCPVAYWTCEYLWILFLALTLALCTVLDVLLLATQALGLTFLSSREW